MAKLGQVLRSNDGTALITVMIVLIMVSVLGMAYVTIAVSSLMQANKEANRAKAFNLAEAGLEYAIDYVTTQSESNGGVVPSCSIVDTPMLSAMAPGASGYISITPNFLVPSIGTITSGAYYGGCAQTVRVFIRIKDLSIWNNAIFAGIGQSGRGINGNVDIRGSVHILGDGEPYTDLNGNGQWDNAESYTDSNGNGQWDAGEPFTDANANGTWDPAEPYEDVNSNGAYDPPLTATDLATTLSGTAAIGSNYDGISAALSSRIPALVPQTWGGESVYTLNTEVRVKHGRVNLSGTATIGKSNVLGNLVKETVDGVYVSDGYGGNQGTNNIFSDNGYGNTYDLGDRIAFPNLLDPYTHPGSGVHYATYEAYLDANSLLVPVTTIASTTPAFSYTDGTNSIAWDPLTGALNITGIVRTAGNLDIGLKGTVVAYNGRGTLFSKGSVSVHGDVMPATTFPVTHALGVISKYDINFATGGGDAQLKATGAWYAQRTINSAKQSEFGGTYVANYFNMGTNVPAIFQVPSLANNLPPGMPGADVHLASVKVLSWKHL